MCGSTLKTVSKSTGKCVKPLYSKLSTVSWYIGNGLGVREKQDESAPGTNNSLGDQGTGILIISVLGGGLSFGTVLPVILGVGSDAGAGAGAGISAFGDGVTSGLDAGSDVDADTDVSVFGDGLDSGVGDDSGCGDAGKVNSPELQALTINRGNNITVIRTFWNCLRHIIQ